MRIEYIFINNYKDIMNNLNLNFGAEVTYNYIGNGKIDYSLNSNYIKNMYKKYDTIENISAIVGKNGVGKTTLLRAINEIFAKKTNFKFIIIYRNNYNKYLYSNMDEKIEIDDLDIKIVKNRKASYILDGGAPANIIYFSSIFDKARKLDNDEFLLDISTNQKVRQLQLEKIFLDPDKEYESITELRRKEIPNVLLLLNALNKNELKGVRLLFEAPEYIEIRVENNIKIYKYNINKLNSEDFHDYKMIDNYEKSINNLYGWVCKKYPLSYKKHLYIEYLLHQPINLFINADKTYNISLVKDIEDLITKFEDIHKTFLECKTSAEGVAIIEDIVNKFNYNVYGQNKGEIAKKENLYASIEYENDKQSVYNLIVNINNIIENILDKYDEDSDKYELGDFISDEIILELCDYLTELDFLEIGDNKKNTREILDDVDLGYLEEEEDFKISQMYNIDEDEATYEGIFYDDIILLNNEIYSNFEDYSNIIEILYDIQEKTQDRYENYLKNINENDKDREKSLKKLNDIKMFEKELESYINFQKAIKALIASDDINVNPHSISSIEKKISIGVDLKNERLLELLDIYSKLSLDKDILSFDWHNLSSGQNAYLDMISRIYMLNRNKDIKESIKDIILLIDEGDLYLHPSAQVEFIYNLIKFVNTVLNNRKIHIILTSNSPFIISDIANDNVIYVNEVNGQVVIDAKKNELLTFGANVNELLIDTFYMENGTKGMYSTLKINEIKDLLKLSDSDFQRAINQEKIDLQDVRNVINCIGEELVRDRLLDLYKKKEKIINSEVDKNVNDLLERFSNLNCEDKKIFIERIIEKLK